MAIHKSLLVAAALVSLANATPGAQSQDVTNPEAAASEEMTPGAQVQSEREIPLAEVPEAALAAAKGALEAEPTAASLLTLIDGDELYQIEATSAVGEELAVHVTPAGEIIRGQNEQQQ
jgi:hypothetical protein